MSNITLTIPNDDHIALRAFGKALEEMALAHGAEPRKTTIDTSEATAVTDELVQTAPQMMDEPEVDTTAQQVESLATVKPFEERLGLLDKALSKETPESLAEKLQLYNPEPTTDSTGTPWDERIHSTSKALNADGTWRLRRKPKDMDEAEWYQLIADVKLELSGEEQYDQEELTRQMDELGVRYDPAHDKGDETAEFIVEPPVTPPGDDFHTDAGVVTEQTVAGIPPLPVPPPVVVAPPVPEFDDGVPFPPSGTVSPALERMADHTTWDFPRLMTFLTERHGEIDVATVNTLLAQDGMSSVQELNAHPDKIGPFVARVKAHLGE